MSHVKVAGVHIDLDQLGKFKTQKDLKAKGAKVFDHLPADEQDKAYDELWAVGYDKLAEETQTPAVAKEAANAATAADEIK